jgi:ATP-dependent DNA ligase
MFKIKHQRTADCVLCGYRIHKTAKDAIGSLLLGLYADDERAAPWGEMFSGLLPIGATASFAMARRKALLVELRPLEIPAAEHPWGAGRAHERDGNPWNPARAAKFVPRSPEPGGAVR